MGSKRFLVVVMMMAGCREPSGPPCPVGETRCEGEVAQICDPGGRWQSLLDCTRVSELSRAAFACGPVVIEDGEVGRLAGHTCLPDRADADAGMRGGAP